MQRYLRVPEPQAPQLSMLWDLYKETAEEKLQVVESEAGFAGQLLTAIATHSLRV